ncbi:golgin subfamily A member 7-like isoform X1 [Cyprinus carpio]|uniref:Golgin subfamily A member 7-like isoform X1 n=1 Tax=Cyprinus carpio TaxID=7962 RepID=A0A9Q9YSD7_CYPCA|nr:golgin subfamily A member 7-like isoform X1 [Cyprinus carpio]
MKDLHLHRVVSQPSGAASQCISGHQSLHSERLQRQHHLQIPDQVPRRAGQQGEIQMKIERSLFEETLKTLNCYYAEAEKIGGQSYLEGCLACATAYIIFLCMETRYEKILKKISMYIQEQNEKIYAPRGLLLTDPIERGMRVIEISIFEDSGSTSSSSSGSSPSSSTAQ